jgi:hypothetical protein
MVLQQQVGGSSMLLVLRSVVEGSRVLLGVVMLMVAVGGSYVLWGSIGVMGCCGVW